MKLQLLSDIHLETQPDFRAEPLPGADLLVVAGDVGSYQPGSKLDPGPGRDFGLSQFASKAAGGKWPAVIYVPGNHEYDGGDFDDIHAELRALCESLGIIWLERESVVIDNTRFIGTTLWSDFDALAAGAPTLALQLKHRDKAFRAANFYLRKAGGTRHGNPFLAQEIREHALVCKDWLTNELAKPFDGNTVVITHFAPSLRSADPRYGLVPGTAGFCNAFDSLMTQADLWIHGHLHCLNDYTVPAETRSGGRCRVVSNALGYIAKGEQEQFRPGLLIEIPSAL